MCKCSSVFGHKFEPRYSTTMTRPNVFLEEIKQIKGGCYVADLPCLIEIL
jgi:hypothetical protein